MFIQTVYLFVAYNYNCCNFEQFLISVSKMHAQFQGCWHRTKPEPLCMTIIYSNEKNLIYNFGNDFFSKMKNSVYNLIGLEDSCICEYCLTEFFCQLRLLKTHFL